MRRREFIGLMGSAAVWALAAYAQATNRPVRIGFLGASRDVGPQAVNYHAFLMRLSELGFNEGQNLTVEYRSTTDPRGIFVNAAELMRAQPDLIVVTGPEVGLQAVVGASRAIPIVVLAVQYDPIERGYIASLARPGGNITGVFLRHLELAVKQVEILTQTFPGKTRLAVLWDALTAPQFGAAEQTARSLNIQLQSLKLEDPPYDFAKAFDRAAAEAADMVLVLSSPFFTQSREQIADAAIAHRLPTMFTFNSTSTQAGSCPTASISRRCFAGPLNTWGGS
jgi:putative tryptophan/tyrosine transport system substrate-binding protein